MFTTLDLAMVSQRWNQSMSNQRKNKLISSKLKSFLHQKIPTKKWSQSQKRRKYLHIVHLTRACYPEYTTNLYSATRHHPNFLNGWETPRHTNTQQAHGKVSHRIPCIHMGMAIIRKTENHMLPRLQRNWSPLPLHGVNVKCAVCVQQLDVSS